MSYELKEYLNAINFTKKDLRTFLLSTRFLFQSLDRVQFFDMDGNLIGDTNILDLETLEECRKFKKTST